jgi:hypothetical protein
MGQHTWFLKSKDLYLKEEELNRKLELFENDEIYLNDMEVYQLNKEIDYIEESNDSEYHDIFRTNKRNENKTYIKDVIFSREECFEWIKNPENCVSFKNSVFDTDEQENINRECAFKDLNEFWDKYPDGVIYFG